MASELTKKFHSSFLVPWDVSIDCFCLPDVVVHISIGLSVTFFDPHTTNIQPRLPWRAISWVWPVSLANKPWASV